MKFELLDKKKHLRKIFDCETEELNFYLQKIANQDQKRNLAKTHVLSDNGRIIGYFSMSSHSVPQKDLPDLIGFGSYKELPFILLGRLAVDKVFKGKGFGDAIITHSFKITLEISKNIGISGIVVDAKDDNSISFYESFGFISLKNTKDRLVLPIALIKSFLRD